MERKTDISALFNSINKMPVEVDFSQVEKFVLAQPATVFLLKSIFSSTKFIIIMTTGIATLITTAVIVFSLNQNNNSTIEKSNEQVQFAPINKVIKPEQNNPQLPQILMPVEAEQAAALSQPIQPALLQDLFTAIDTTKRKTSVAISNGPGYSMTSVSDGDSVYTSTSIGTNANGFYSTSTNTANGATATTNNANTFFTTNDCTNGNAYQNIIEDSLIADGLIKSEKKYKYLLTETNFIVNGENQNDLVREKYSAILFNNSCFKFSGDYQIAFSKNGESISLTTSSGN